MSCTADDVVLGGAVGIRGSFKRLNNGAMVLFDPTTVMFSFIKPDGTEEALTYSGGETYDDQVSRLITGVYSAFLVSDQVGPWRIRAYYENTEGGVTVPVKSQELTIQVISDDHSFADS